VRCHLEWCQSMVSGFAAGREGEESVLGISDN